MTPKTLDELHAARAKLLKREAALWERRQKLSTIDRDAEKCEHALLTSRTATSSEIENWMADGAKGVMPGVSSTGLAQLQDCVLNTRSQPLGRIRMNSAPPQPRSGLSWSPEMHRPPNLRNSTRKPIARSPGARRAPLRQR